MMGEDKLLALINATIADWVDEEMDANDGTVSREQRLEEHRAEFLIVLSEAWNEEDA